MLKKNISDASAWKQLVKDHLVDAFSKRKPYPPLSENSKRTYSDNLFRLMADVGANNINELSEITVEDAIKKLKTFKNSDGTISSKLNAFVAIVNHKELSAKFSKKGKENFAEWRKINAEMGRANITRMNENKVQDFPDIDTKKIDEYIQKNAGKRQSLLLAIMMDAPVRSHMLVNVEIARSRKDYDKLKSEGKSVITLEGELFVPRMGTKNKDSDYEEKFNSRVASQLKLFVRPDQKYLFQVGERPTGDQSIKQAIKKAFQHAGVPDVGNRVIRRFHETNIVNNPTLNVADRANEAKRLGHSLGMQMKYAVKDSGKRKTRGQQKAIDDIGMSIAALSTRLISLTDVSKLRMIDSGLKEILGLLA